MKRIAFFLVVCLAAIPVSAQNTFESALNEAVADIRQKLPQNVTVAVPDFVIPQDVMAEQSAVQLSDYLIAELSSRLVNTRRFKVLERQKINMNVVKSSLGFDASGDVSDESAQRIGHFLGAQYLVIGSLKMYGQQIQFYVETVKAEDTEKIASTSKPISRSELSAFYSTQAWPQPASFSGKTITTSDTGVYVGIVSFGDEADDLTRGTPVFLDAKGLERINTILDRDYKRTTRPGTVLFYGVHRALASLSANAGKYPLNLDGVYLLTFTDGLDAGSTGFLSPVENQDFSDKYESDYQAYLQGQIMNRPVAGRAITAYSAGVRGSDVQDTALFRSSLSGLASSPGNFFELSNFSQLNLRFDAIAKNLTVTTENTTFELRTPSFSRGTKIRMTFDSVTSADVSKRYVEGTVASTPNRTFKLTNVVFSGTSSDAGLEIEGVMNGNEVIYTFPNFKGFNSTADRQVKQWTQRNGSTVWQVNSEYETEDSTKTRTETKSAVVYIALDSSRSLSDNDVEAVRTAMKQFVRTLYERSQNKPAPAVQQITSSQTTSSMPANFVRIAGGTFTMGSPASEVSRYDNEVQHQVTISRPFYLSKYEVTQKEWVEVMGSNPSFFKGDDLPVEQVSWYDVIEYCNKRSEKERLTPAYTIDKTRSDVNNTNGSDNVKWVVTWNRNANGYRLPTEAEWELACRAGTTTPFYTGNNITTNHANYNGNNPYNNNAKGEYRGKTWTVGSGTPNPWGLYNMSGNVWEWCWDWYGGYSSSAQTDPLGASSGTYRVERGGSWYYGGQNLRSAYRGYNTPSGRSDHFGFRLARPSL
ncbi:MAG: SUMF1/EgtB/PvdO family nonheme iron enzyme [Treponema sp.]|jgi:formylglycine-generating enzyme required for sulfatase activity/TolB-like protein|nr:SUMF1/EgtB/PvdO family nonheme iron enzyme [Treponema sp.]